MKKKVRTKKKKTVHTLFKSNKTKMMTEGIFLKIVLYIYIYHHFFFNLILTHMMCQNTNENRVKEDTDVKLK